MKPLRLENRVFAVSQGTSKDEKHASGGEVEPPRKHIALALFPSFLRKKCKGLRLGLRPTHRMMISWMFVTCVTDQLMPAVLFGGAI